MVDRSVKVEPQAIEKVQQALDRQHLQQELLYKVAGLEPQTVARFLSGQSVDFATIIAIYSTLDLTWEEGDTLTLTDVDDSPLNGRKDLEAVVQRVRQTCCDRLRQRYGKLSLLDGRTVERSGYSADVYAVTPLSRKSYISISTYLADFDQSQNFNRFGLGERQARMSGLQAANHFDKLMVLGKAGAGKSTFLQSLALACCEGTLQGDRIPVFLDLKTLPNLEVTNLSFLQDPIHQHFGLKHPHQSEELLHLGRALILCDGLDEIPSHARRNVQYQLRNFSQRYYKNHFIFTSQTQITDYAFPNFEFVELAEFTPAQQKQFIQRWFAASESAESPAPAQGLSHRLTRRRHRRLAATATTPFLLGLICWAVREQPTRPFYSCDLYEGGLTLLLHQIDEWEGEKEGPLITAQRFDLLSYLALRTLEKGELFFSANQGITYLTEGLKAILSKTERKQALEIAGAVFDAIEHQYRLVVERAQGIYSFSDLTLHQYFAGRALSANLADRDLEQAFGQFTPKSWREILFEAVNHLHEADDLLLHLKRRIDGLVTDDPRLQLFLAWVTQKADLAGVSYKPAAVRAFYFSLGIDRDLQPKLAHPLDFSHAVDRALKSPLHNRALAGYLDEKLQADFQQDAIHSLDRELLLDLILDCLLVTFAHDLDLFLTFVEDRQLDIEPDLKEGLEELNEQVADLRQDRRAYDRWWASNSQAWTQNLRLTIIGYRNMGYAWRLTPQQKNLLQRYYQANKFLIECLKSSDRVTPQLRREIEETLFLPLPSMGYPRSIQ